MHDVDGRQVEGGTELDISESEWLINPGSVGQPRDGDWRACFVTVEDDGTVHYHRVEYDVESAAAKIDATSGMGASLASRLRRGR